MYMHTSVIAVQLGDAYWTRDDLVILHSDRGGKFFSDTYQRFLGGHTLVCSMSAVGHCGDNAACEGFFGIINSPTSSGSTIPECAVELPGVIGSFRP